MANTWWSSLINLSWDTDFEVVNEGEDSNGKTHYHFTKDAQVVSPMGMDALQAYYWLQDQKGV